MMMPKIRHALKSVLYHSAANCHQARKVYLWPGPHGSHASRAAHSLHRTQVRMAWMRGKKNNTTWGPAERESVRCSCECTSHTLWSCRVHVGYHGMRTWTSPWWLMGKQHKDWLNVQFHVNMTWCVWGVCMNATSTWLLILMGGPLGPPAKRGDMKDCDKNIVAPWDFAQWIYVKLKVNVCECWKQDKALSCDECQSTKHQHWEPAFPYDRTDRKKQ